MTAVMDAPAPETTETETPAAEAVPTPAPGAEVALRTQPAAMAMGAKLRYAETLAKSGLLPRDYRHNPANVLFGVEYGQMLGLQPMAAITGIHVIDGKPTASAALISALVRRAGHKLRVGYEAAKMTGWAEIVRADDPGFTFRCEWDLPRAIIAELCTLKDGKPFARDSKGKPLPWQKFFPSMTKARAITEVARDACEEVLFGLHYTPDELDGDIGSVVTGEIEADPWAAPPVETDQAWLAAAVDGAAKFADLGAGRKLWQAVTAKASDGQCTPEDAKRVTDMIEARVEELKAAEAKPPAAEPADAEVVDAEIVDDAGQEPDDNWAVAVLDIIDADDAAAARANLRLALKAGSVTSARHDQVLAAIDARAADFGRVAA